MPDNQSSPRRADESRTANKPSVEPRSCRAVSTATRRFCRRYLTGFLAASLIAGCGDWSNDSEEMDPLVAKGNGPEIVAAVSSETAPVATAVPEDEFAQLALQAINEARAQARVCGDTQMPGVGPVLWNDQIAHAALLESEWMQRENTFGHAWPDGTRVGDRLDIAGYDWHRGDENIAAGFGTLGSAMQAWIDSPPHCRALMRGDLSEVGLAVVPGTGNNTYNAYWTMVLAEPRLRALQTNASLN